MFPDACACVGAAGDGLHQTQAAVRPVRDGRVVRGQECPQGQAHAAEKDGHGQGHAAGGWAVAEE